MQPSILFSFTMKIVSILLLLPSISAFTPFGVSTHNPSSSALFGLVDFKADMVNPKSFILDVREADEWNDGHLALATPSPLSQLQSGTWMDSTTGVISPGSFPIDRKTSVAILKNKKIFIHSCAKGGTRAKKAAELLAQMGYSDVVALEETFDELAAAGLCDVVTGTVQSLFDATG